MFFCDVERPKVRESKPELIMTEISKVLGGMWSELDTAQKEKYKNMAENDRERYLKEMEEYKKTVSEDKPNTKKQK